MQVAVCLSCLCKNAHIEKDSQHRFSCKSFSMTEKIELRFLRATYCPGNVVLVENRVADGGALQAGQHIRRVKDRVYKKVIIII